MFPLQFMLGSSRVIVSVLICFLLQLHQTQSDPDVPLLEHVQELLAILDALGIQPSPVEDDEEGNGDGWEDFSDDEDVEMS